MLNWPDQLQRMWTNRRWETKKPTRVPFFASWNTWTFNFCNSLKCARGNESMQVNRNINLMYGRKKHPLTSYTAEKHSKRSKFAITDMRQKPVDFFCMTQASALTPAIILLNIGFFAKVSVPLQFIIPWRYIVVCKCVLFKVINQ